MTPERWQSVKSVLAGALELPNGDRALYLARACRSDPSMLRDVQNLLDADAIAGPGFLEEPPLLSGEEELAVALDRWIGRQVGAYRIVAPLGAGGMGTVYRASRIDEAYEADVAIKIVRDESGMFVSRFKTERQILAGLQHPNIARLLDGGTTADGLPYFVMELIAGEPLHQFCERRALSIESRLALFLTICSAVDYAHHRLVVHRDIKPGNILVTPDGVPKLLDFGIARIMDSPAGVAASLTRSGPWPMTPAYASPEQLRGEEITTASDVYSLGLVLHELLTGTRAFDVGSLLPHEAAQLLIETEPRRPSAVAPSVLRRRLAGDLDTIVAKATRKDPGHRYASVEALAADIRRHLDGRPISARGESLLYRGGKFLRRNARSVAVGVVVVCVVAAAGVVALRSSAIARAERVRSTERLDDLRQLARANLFELNDAIQRLPGSAAARNLLIQRTLQYLDHVSAGSGGARELQEELAVGYERIAQLQGNFSAPGIGNSLAALESYRKAVGIRDALLAAHPADEAEVSASSDLLSSYARTLQLVNRIGDAADAARRAVALAERAVRLRQRDPQSLTREAAAYGRLASILGGTGSSSSTREIAAAVDNEWRALAILDALPRASIDAHVRDVMQTLRIRLGLHLSKARAFGESSRVFAALLSGEHAQALDPAELSLVYNYRGLMYDRAGDYRRALADFTSDLDLQRARTSSAPADLTAKIDLAIAKGDVGIETARLGDSSSGLAELGDAIQTAEQMMAADPSQLFYANLLVIAYGYQGEVLSSLGDQAGATAKYDAALKLANRLSRSDPQDLESPLSIAKIHAALAVILGRAGRCADALQHVDAARETLAALIRVRPSDPEAAYVDDLNAANAVLLRACLHGQPRTELSGLRLPNLLN